MEVSGCLLHPGAFSQQGLRDETRVAFRQTSLVWKPALEAAGLPAALGFHCLRHTYASGLIAEGLHPRVVMARLGHASIEETMNTYGHLFPDSLEKTTAALDRLFGAG